MDQLDQKILEILRRDARTTNTEIARRVGLTEGAVRNRIRKLVKTGVIRRFTVELGEHAGVEAIVLIRSHAKETKRVAREVKRLVERVFETSGEYDIAAHVWAKDVDELNRIVDEIRAIDGVTGTTTLIRLVADP